MVRASLYESSEAGRLMGAKDLIDDDIYDSTGRCLGEIEDIMLDPQTGCVRYAVVALGGFFGFGRKRFAVPWSALTPDAKLRRSVVDVAKMRLTALPMSTKGRSRGNIISHDAVGMP